MANEWPTRNPVVALRDWARTAIVNGSGAVSAAGGVWKGAPETDGTHPVVYPYVLLRRVGGQAGQGGTPTDAVLIQFDVIGDVGKDQDAENCAYDLVTAVQSAKAGTALGSNLILQNALVANGPLQFPDPANDRPRYIVDVRFTVIARA